MNRADFLFEKIDAHKRGYRPLPFWSLNDALTPEETARQVREMSEQGCGGYFMHARSGLLTDYMGGEWFRCLDSAVEQGSALGADSYVYDENGWPSGFADGAVVRAHPEYCLKWLACVPADAVGAGDSPLAYYRVRGGAFARTDSASGADIAVCVRTSPDYVDVLDEETVRCFIGAVYEKYRERYGSRIRGFFTDEPQYGKRTFPWSRLFAEKFAAKYGCSIFDRLPCLFFEFEDSASFRYDFYALAEDLLCGAYYRQIGEWCARYGYIFTGHGFDENSLFGQTVNCGDIMRMYEYMQMPGIDWLGRTPCPMYVPRQVSSVARQLGKPRVLTESFALCGWSVGLKRLRSIAERQFAGGVNVVCQHLFAYSLKGERKRDYPPSHFQHQTWWKEYRGFSDYLASLGSLLSSCEPSADLLVLSPVRSAFMLYSEPQTDAMRAYESAFSETIAALEDLAVAYELGCEGILARHGRAEGGLLHVGRRAYARVLLPDCIGLDESTFRLLKDFAEQGGELCYCGRFPERLGGRRNSALLSLRGKAVRIESVSQLRRGCPAYRLQSSGGAVFFQGETDGAYILFASNAHGSEASFSVFAERGRALYRVGLEDGSCVPFAGGNVLLEPYGSALIVCLRDCGESGSAPQAESALPVVPDSPPWKVRPEEDNVLVLDRGEYSFCGGAYREMRDVRLLFGELMRGRKNGPLKIRYTVEIESLPSRILFAAETPQDKTVFINGRKAVWADMGSYIDPSIRKTDAAPFLCEGANEIVVETYFRQSDHTYHVYNDDVLATEKNKIRYDSELENCYLLGDFGVRAPFAAENGLIYSGGAFTLVQRPSAVPPDAVTESGWPFFYGTMQLDNTFTLHCGARRHVLRLSLMCGYAKVYVNGSCAWEGYGPECAVDVTPFLREGRNELSVRIYSEMRNVFGPFHHRGGDPAFVGSTAFADGHGWSDPEGSLWRPRYAFVPFGFRVRRQ